MHNPCYSSGNCQSVSLKPHPLQGTQGQKIQALPLPGCVTSSRSFTSLTLSVFICEMQQ